MCAYSAGLAWCHWCSPTCHEAALGGTAICLLNILPTLACACCRWEWEDLEPYVQDLRGPGQTAEALLLKYTRASQQKPTDPVTYSMR